MFPRFRQGNAPSSPPANGTAHSALTPLSSLVILTSTTILLLFGLPQIALIVRGIQTRGWEDLPQSGIPEALLLSGVTTAFSTLFTLLLGTPLAYLLARRRFLFRRLCIVVVELPIVLPPTVAGLALLLTFGRRGMLGGVLSQVGISLPFTLPAVVIAQVFVSAPFFIRAAQVGFANIPREIEEAARVDGASGVTLIRYITLPLASNALAAGLTLSWARALGEFGATILFAGSIAGRTQTMTLLVYNAFERDVDAAIWAGLILLGLAFVALLLLHWLARRSEIVD